MNNVKKNEFQACKVLYCHFAWNLLNISNAKNPICCWSRRHLLRLSIAFTFIGRRTEQSAGPGFSLNEQGQTRLHRYAHAAVGQMACA
jgi:hypothetical protein